MTGKRRGRTGRGWDAAPPRTRSAPDNGGDTASDNGRDSDSDRDRDRDSDRDSDAGTEAGPGARTARSRSRGGAWGSGGRSAANRGSSSFGSASGSDALGPGSGSSGSGRSADQPSDPAERAREICLRLLSFRPRTRAELATALRERGITDEVSAEVLDRYGEVGIIDDEAFARAWVSSRHHGRGLARKALAGELRRKGVDSEAVGAALDELDPEVETQTARALVERKLRSDRGAPREALLRRLVGMLARKGYPPGLAFKVVKDALEEHADATAFASAELDEGELDTDLLEAEQRAAEAGFA